MMEQRVLGYDTQINLFIKPTKEGESVYNQLSIIVDTSVQV